MSEKERIRLKRMNYIYVVPKKKEYKEENKTKPKCASLSH